MDEAMRHRIHGRFEEQLGAEEAAAVMTARTPSSSIDERFDRLERQLFELRSEVNQLYRWTHDRAGGNMALDEAMRHRIHGRLEELLGHDEAAALMATLPPSDVATKDDLAHLREVLELHISTTVANAVGALRAEMNHQYRWTLQWLVGSMLAAGSLGVTAGALL